MKKSLFTFILVFLFVSCYGQCCAGEEISAKAAIVYEPISETILYEKLPDERLPVASTTKIMTAKVILDNCALDELVTVKKEHTATEGSSMYLKAGEKYTVEELLYGLMLASGNDAASALADHCAGSMDAFAELMNEEAEKLGLNNTHFVNSHGLDAEEHYSTARDLAILTAAAMEDENFCKIFSTETYEVKGTVYRNHSKLLGSCSGCIGGKTGYTEKAGRILVSCVERDNMRLICVTISDPRDWDDHRDLYDKCFEEYEFYSIPKLCSEGELISDNKSTVALNFAQAGLCIERGDEISLKVHMPRFVFPPVRFGENAGYIEVLGKERSYGCVDILFDETVDLNKDKGFKRSN